MSKRISKKPLLFAHAGDEVYSAVKEQSNESKS